jgi:hypothetical protein
MKIRSVAEKVRKLLEELTSSGAKSLACKASVSTGATDAALARYAGTRRMRAWIAENFILTGRCVVVACGGSGVVDVDDGKCAAG